MRTLKGRLKDADAPMQPTAGHPTFSVIAPSLKPASTDGEYRISEKLAAFDQEDWGSCVLNAWVGCLEILQMVEGKSVQSMARAWAYAQCRLVMGTYNEDSGTYPYLAADRLMKIGVVPEDAFPYVRENMPPAEGVPPYIPAHPSAALYIEASDNKITGAYSIDAEKNIDRLDAIEQAVRANHPVPWGAEFNVSELSAWDASSPPLDIPTSTDGGHSTLITGVRHRADGRDFRVRNSWGQGWGDNGYFWIKDRYLASNLASDFWVGTRMQALIV